MPSSYEQLIEDYVDFRDDPANRIPESTTIAALLYDQVASAGGSAPVSDATAANQITEIAGILSILEGVGTTNDLTVDETVIGLLKSIDQNFIDTEENQDNLIAKNEAIRALIAALLQSQDNTTAQIESDTANLLDGIDTTKSEITKLCDALGYTSASGFKLKDRLNAIQGILTHLGTAADASIDFDQTGSISQRLRGIQTELANLSGDGDLGVVDLTGLDAGAVVAPIPTRTNYVVVQAENADPNLIRFRAAPQVVGSASFGVDKAFDLIERQWVPYIVNRNPHLIPVYSSATVLQFFPSPFDSEAAALNLSCIFSAKDTPSGLLIEDDNAKSANVDFSSELIASNVIQSLIPKNRKQYKYAIFKFNQTFSPVAVRPRQVTGSVLVNKDRIFDVALGEWVDEMTTVGHAYVVPLYAAINLTIFNVDGGNQTADFVGQVVFTNSNIDISTSGGGSSSSASLAPIAPALTLATASGSIAAGAKFATFTIYPGTTGTILGTTITPEVEYVDLPHSSAGYDAIPYTITAGQILITSGS